MTKYDLALPSGMIIDAFELSIGPDLSPCYGSDGTLSAGYDEATGDPIPFSKEDRKFIAALAISYWTKFAEQP
ncbi:MAG: hypothetical protein ABFE16_10050 [Armatimonadia bacterium]